MPISNDPLMGMLACVAFQVVDHPISVVFLSPDSKHVANCSCYKVRPQGSSSETCPPPL